MLDPLMRDGTMPNLARLAASGNRRVLQTQHPPLSPLVWTTMMTGVSPLEHRVLDFTRFNPSTREKEPITSDERAVPAVWNIATYGGRKTGVFGLWATDPPETINGLIVSDREVAANGEPMQRVVAETETVRARALEWIRREKPDLAIVYFKGTDEIGHLVAGDVRAARDYFHRIDAIIGEFDGAAKALDAELIIVSDHGFDWGGRHLESSTSIATAGKWHRDEGIFLSARGDGREASVDGVAATLISLLGLPADARMAPAISGVVVPSKENLDYRRYWRRQSSRASARADDAEAVARLKALGYISAGEMSRAPGDSTRTPASFNNEGLILRERGRSAEAERAFLGALALDPRYPAARTNLADLLMKDARTIETLTRVIAIDDRDDARLLRGRYLLEKQDCRAARDDFRAIKADSAIRYASLAAAEGCLGNDDAAGKAIRRSLEIDPSQPELRALLRPGL
jgi:tetratricopeptide (TPR) repeat protein